VEWRGEGDGVLVCVELKRVKGGKLEAITK